MHRLLALLVGYLALFFPVSAIQSQSSGSLFGETKQDEVHRAMMVQKLKDLAANVRKTLVFPH